ncbi:MAG: DEAD/DEAH box helicase [Parachlamydiaceae bacterium]
MKSFEALFSHPEVLRAVEDAGYTEPTAIQEKAIPEVIKGSDLFASAQTGTGKTAAFILPSLVRMAENPPKAQVTGPRILVLVPTRELATQVSKVATKYSKYLSKTKVVTIFGGSPYPIQNRQLSRPYEILIATPGRLMDHMERGRIDFSRLDTLILDEADRMLDMGFIHDVEAIASKTPSDRQTLLFSATLSPAIKKLSSKLLKNPVEICIEPEFNSKENIDQKLMPVDNLDHKYRLLDHLISDPELSQAIIFTSTKRQADLLADKLSDAGQKSAVLHGDMKQSARNRTIALLRSEKIKLLVATDVAARGIDVSTLSHVINFDMPQCVEDYVHRIGRTGRAGASGTALSFATENDTQMVKRIEKYTSKKLTLCVIPGFEPRKKGTSSPKKDNFPPRRNRFNSRRRR